MKNNYDLPNVPKSKSDTSRLCDLAATPSLIEEIYKSEISNADIARLFFRIQDKKKQMVLNKIHIDWIKRDIGANQIVCSFMFKRKEIKSLSSAMQSTLPKTTKMDLVFLGQNELYVDVFKRPVSAVCLTIQQQEPFAFSLTMRINTMWRFSASKNVEYDMSMHSDLSLHYLDLWCYFRKNLLNRVRDERYDNFLTSLFSDFNVRDICELTVVDGMLKQRESDVVRKVDETGFLNNLNLRPTILFDPSGGPEIDEVALRREISKLKNNCLEKFVEDSNEDFSDSSVLQSPGREDCSSEATVIPQMGIFTSEIMEMNYNGAFMAVKDAAEKYANLSDSIESTSSKCNVAFEKFSRALDQLNVGEFRKQFMGQMNQFNTNNNMKGLTIEICKSFSVIYFCGALTKVVLYGGSESYLHLTISAIAVSLYHYDKLADFIKFAFNSMSNKVVPQAGGDLFLSGVVSLLMGTAFTNTKVEKLPESVLKHVAQFPKVKDGFKEILDYYIVLIKKICDRANMGAYFPNKLQTYFIQHDEIKEIVQRIESLNNEINTGDYLFCDQNFENLEELISDIDKILFNLSPNSIGPKIFILLQNESRALKSLLHKFVSSNYRMEGERVEPVGIMLVGSSGIGKTNAAKHAANELGRRAIPLSMREEYDRDPSKFMYTVMHELKFLDGLTLKHVVAMFDEFFAARDVPGIPDNEAFKWIRMVNIFPMLCHMAHVDQKGTVWFKCKYVIGTTNSMNGQCQSISSHEALWRRFHVLVLCYPKDEFCTEETLHGALESRKIDFTKLPLGDITTKLSPEQLNYVQIDYAKPHWRGKVFSYRELIQHCTDLYDEHTLQYRQSRLDMQVYSAEFEKERILFEKLQEQERIDAEKALIQSMPVPQFNFDKFPGREQIVWEEQTNELLEFVDEVIDGFERGQLVKDHPELGVSEELASANFIHVINGWKFKTGRSRCKLRMATYLILMQFGSVFLRTILIDPDRAVDLIVYALENGTVDFNVPIPIRRSGYVMGYYEKVCELFFEFCENKYIKGMYTSFRSLLKSTWLHWCVSISVLVGVVYGLYRVLKPKSTSGLLMPSKMSREEYEKTYVNGILDPNKVVEHLLMNDPQSGTMRPSMPIRTVSAPQMGDDDPAGVQVVDSIVRKNMYRFTTFNGTKLGYITFIVGQIAIMPIHFITRLENKYRTHGKDFKVCIEKISRTNREMFRQVNVSWIIDPINLRQCTAMQGLDLVLVRFPSDVWIHMDITKFFFSSDDLGKLSTQIDVRLIGNDNNAISQILTTARAVPRYEYVDPDDGPISLRDGWIYVAPTQLADCGLLLTHRNRSIVNTKLIGLHTAGSDLKVAFGTCVRKEQLLETLQLFGSFDKPEQDFFVEPQCNRLTATNCLECNGLVERPHVPMSNTRIIKSKLYSAWSVPRLAPTLLHSITRDGEIIDPIQIGLDRFNFKKIVPNHTLLTSAVDFVFNDMNKNEMFKVDRRVYTFEEAVNGTDDPEFGSLSRMTSPGYKWKLEKSRGMKGKTYWFGDDQKYDLSTPQCKALKQSVENTINKASKGIRELHLYTINEKDEKTKEINRYIGKTRMYFGSEQDLSIGFRQYYGAIILSFTKNRIYNGFGVGINPYSQEWHQLYKRVSRFGEYFLCGDFKQFDVHQYGDIHWLILDKINQWYSDGNDRIRRVLWYEITQSQHVLENFILGMCFSLPSGSAMTPFINSVYNRIAHVYCFGRCFGNDLSMMLNYNEFVSDQFFGDDSILGVSPRVHSCFNFDTIQEYMSEIGLVYTNVEGKVLTGGFVPMDRLVFLKRGFRFCNYVDRVVAPLELLVILEQPYWTKDTPDRDIITQDVLNISIRELSLHPRSTFNEWSTLIAMKAIKYGFSVDSLHYETLLEDVSKMLWFF